MLRRIRKARFPLSQ